MKVLVTGAKGQLGKDLIAELNKRNIDYVGVDVEEMDITDGDAVLSVIGKERPDVVIHTAAWTAVDAAEDYENRDKVYKINVIGTENVAKACKSVDAAMIYISTDYVFHGEGTTPYKPEDENFAPLNYYGECKLQGELAVKKHLEKFFIVRTAWVFGLNGTNFIKTMLKLSEMHDSVRVVNDQVGTPTYTVDLARLLVDMSESKEYGIYHATNEGGYISWYDFAKEIFLTAGLKTEVFAVSSTDYGFAKAKRPFNSRLDKTKLVEKGFTPLPDWKDALKRYLKELKNYGTDQR